MHRRRHGRGVDDRAVSVRELADSADTESPDSSAFALGHDLFGHRDGPVDLAIKRKALLTEVWAENVEPDAPQPAVQSVPRP